MRYFSVKDVLLISDMELLPSLNIISKITSLGSINISDIESTIPNPINSKYYYPSIAQNEWTSLAIPA